MHRSRPPLSRHRTLAHARAVALAATIVLAVPASGEELFQIANVGTALPVASTATSLLVADGFALLTVTELPIFGEVAGERENEVFRVGPDFERFSFVADLCSGRCDGFGVVAAVEVDGETFFGVRRFSTLPPGPAPALGWGICAVASAGGAPRCLAEGNAGELVALADRVLFTLAPPNGAGGFGPEALGATDGTSEGTRLLVTPPPLSRLVRVGGTAFFLASAGDGGVALWRSDGTAGGTASVAPVPAAVAPGWEPVVAGGRLFFVADGGLWTSDGTAPGTCHLLGGLAAETVLFPAGSRVFFARRKGGKVQLFTSDGTGGGTRPLGAVRPPDLDFDGGRGAIGQGGRFFFANRNGSREELWTSDGTAAGTRLLSRLGVQHGPGRPRNFAALDGQRALFTVESTDGRRRPWVSDGRSGGTRPLPFEPLGGGSISGFRVGDGVAYAFAGGVIPGAIFRTDGTAAGSGVFEIRPAPGNTVGAFAGVLGRTLLHDFRDRRIGFVTGFGAFDVVSGSRPVPPPLGDDAGSWPASFAVADDRLYFAASASGQPSLALWEWDGVAPPREVVSRSALPSAIDRVLAAGSTPVFTVLDQLWAFDGETAEQLGDLPPVGDLVAAGDRIFFTTEREDPVLGVSDGTATGTRLLVRLPRPAWALTPGGGGAFVLDAPGLEPERATLWWSDGTPEGTARAVGRIAMPGTPRLPVLDDEAFYAPADDRNELWRSDGVRGHERKVASFGEPGEARVVAATASTDGVFVLVDHGGPGPALWWTAPHASPRRLLDLPRAPGDLVGPPREGHAPTFDPLLAVGPSVAFSLDDGVHGEELWWSDGTVEGTGLVADLCPGPCSSLPARACVVGDLLAFAAVSGGATGLEAWVSDGTEAGTLPLPEVAPGPRGSYPRGFAAFRDLLVFSADDGASGAEPWAYRP